MCAVAAFTSEEGYWKEFRTLSVMPLLKSASQARSSQWSLVYLRFCTSSGEFAKAFFCGHGKDLEDNLSQFTLTQIMRTFPLLPSSSPPPPTSMHTTRIPVESSQLPTPSPWNGHYGTASYVYLVCVDLLSSLYTYHSVDQNGTQRVMRSFCASISCLAL